MAKVAMENYDPEFSKIVKRASTVFMHSLFVLYVLIEENLQGDILVGGFNFGTGSSREQAATALKYAGTQVVLAGSFSETFKRNAINNGLLVLEAPELVEDLRAKFSSEPEELTRRTGLQAQMKLDSGEISLEKGKKYSISPVGIAAQEIMVAGGLEEWVKLQLLKN
jgi:homoaconitate hydratase